MYIYFPHNFTEKNFIQNFDIFFDSARRDLSIEPLNNQGWYKNALELILFVTPRTWSQVAYG